MYNQRSSNRNNNFYLNNELFDDTKLVDMGGYEYNFKLTVILS